MTNYYNLLKQSLSEAAQRETAEDPKFHTHIQKAAGRAAEGDTIHFKHGNGKVTVIDPPMGKKLNKMLNDPNLRGTAKADTVERIHKSPEHLDRFMKGEKEEEKKPYLSQFKKMREEAEQIDEVGDTRKGVQGLVNYLSKASDARGHRGLPLNKVDKRYKGIERASKRVGNVVDARMRLATTKEEVEQVDESKPNKKQVKQAFGIARDKRYAAGNMTGAVDAMDKINKGLAQHPSVKKELQKQNEEIEQHENKEVTGMFKDKISKSFLEAINQVKKHGVEEAMDPVGGEDKDVNNDGKSDKSDSYLKNRRKAIGASMKKEEIEQVDELKKTTVRSYYNKAGAQGKEIFGKMAATGGDWSKDGKDTDTLRKRTAGRKMALKRRNGEVKMSTEEAEQVAEAGDKSSTYRQGRTWGPVNPTLGVGAGDNVGAQLKSRSMSDVAANLRSSGADSRVAAAASKLTTKVASKPETPISPNRPNLQQRMSDIAKIAPATSGKPEVQKAVQAAATQPAPVRQAAGTPLAPTAKPAKIDPNAAKFKAADAASMKNVNVGDLNRIQNSKLSNFGKAFQTARSLQGVKSDAPDAAAAKKGKAFSFKGKSYGITRKDEL